MSYNIFWKYLYTPFIILLFYSFIFWYKQYEDEHQVNQWLRRLSIKSGFRQLLLSLDLSRSQHPLNCLVSKSLGLDISQNFQSRKVLVSTSFVFWVSQIHCQYIIWNISTILLISDQIMNKSGTNYQFPLNAFV